MMPWLLVASILPGITSATRQYTSAIQHRTQSILLASFLRLGAFTQPWKEPKPEAGVARNHGTSVCPFSWQPLSLGSSLQQCHVHDGVQDEVVEFEAP